ncbi:MAG TPA: CPBP family intramembrane metalloprotease [Gammaproteobacteria bacterium]|nr:CPBP family intramembrane metalloprotease [Gammaproteobacteria bacterium]
MLGILLILLLSWALLHFIAEKNLMVLGPTPVPLRLLQFVLGFVLLFVLSLIAVMTDTLVYSIQWQQVIINPNALFQSFWYYLKSALTEDLVFRGAVLYLLIRKLGAIKAIVISSIIFGAYHWFSYGMFNGEVKIIALIYVLLLTGLIGASWAYTYHKTQSIIMPLGMHTGSNFAMSLFFQNNPYGEMIFSQVSRVEINEWINLFYLLTKAVLLPLLVVVIVNHSTKFEDKT